MLPECSAGRGAGICPVELEYLHVKKQAAVICSYKEYVANPARTLAYIGTDTQIHSSPYNIGPKRAVVVLLVLMTVVS